MIGDNEYDNRCNKSPLSFGLYSVWSLSVLSSFSTNFKPSDTIPAFVHRSIDLSLSLIPSIAALISSKAYLLLFEFLFLNVTEGIANPAAKSSLEYFSKS
jgi:hypothetical protein